MHYFAVQDGNDAKYQNIQSKNIQLQTTGHFNAEPFVRGFQTQIHTDQPDTLCCTAYFSIFDVFAVSLYDIVHSLHTTLQTFDMFLSLARIALDQYQSTAEQMRDAVCDFNILSEEKSFCCVSGKHMQNTMRYVLILGIRGLL